MAMGGAPRIWASVSPTPTVVDVLPIPPLNDRNAVL